LALKLELKELYDIIFVHRRKTVEGRAERALYFSAYLFFFEREQMKKNW